MKQLKHCLVLAKIVGYPHRVSNSAKSILQADPPVTKRQRRLRSVRNDALSKLVPVLGHKIQNAFHGIQCDLGLLVQMDHPVVVTQGVYLRLQTILQGPGLIQGLAKGLIVIRN